MPGDAGPLSTATVSPAASEIRTEACGPPPRPPRPPAPAAPPRGCGTGAHAIRDLGAMRRARALECLVTDSIERLTQVRALAVVVCPPRGEQERRPRHDPRARRTRPLLQRVEVDDPEAPPVRGRD